MLTGLRFSSRADPEFARATGELMQSTTRNLIVTTGAIYFLWHLVATLAWPDRLGGRVWLTTLAVLGTCGLAYWLLERNLLASQVVWQVGLALSILLAVQLFRQPMIAALCALLPLVSTVTIGWPAGLAAEAAVVAIGLWLAGRPDLQPFPSPYVAGIVIGGAFAGLLGWASERTLLTITQWSVESFAEAQRNMDEARQHRAQLARVLKDLDHAYYRLQRANAALVAARKAAEDAERFKAEFVTNVSHELRTPLNLIVGFSEMMVTAPESYDGLQLPGPYRSDLNTLYQSARHLLALVDDVLDLARIEVGRIALARDEVDVAALVFESVEMVRDYVAAKGLELQVNVAPDLPPLWIDRLRIRQVLLNLLVNAARFTEQGWIRLEASREGEEVLVRVTDTGRGIPKQDLPKIFDEFRSTEQPVSTWHSGTGLGLPISRKFVELHGGRMDVESVYTQGSSFWFSLPCAAAPVDPSRWVGPGRQPLPPLGASERIVVVAHEDAQVATLLQRYLDGYRVISVADPGKAAALIDEVKPVALVSDGRQPPPAAAPDLLTVRCPLPSGRRAALALGADDFLVKPVSRQDLWAAIDRLGRPVRRILIADDDPEVVRLYRRMLRTRIPGRDCLEAFNGEETLLRAREEAPDLVLLDLMMPVVDGIGVLERMSADPALAGIPVIIVSARDQDQASLPIPGAIQVSRGEGFQLGEVVRTLKALFSALAPGWHPSGSMEPAPAEAPVEPPAS
jgi:signal transduction histidine kinase/CheY-like chemotaxis protein